MKKQCSSKAKQGVEGKYVYSCTTKGSLVDNEVVSEEPAPKNSKGREAAIVKSQKKKKMCETRGKKIKIKNKGRRRKSGSMV